MSEGEPAGFSRVLRAVLRPASKIALRMTAHGARLEGPGAAVTDELRAAAEAHRPRLTVLAKVMRQVTGRRGRTLAPCFEAWPGDAEAGFLTCWFAEFGGALREEGPFALGPASTITDPSAFCESLHRRLKRLQRGDLRATGAKATLRRDLSRLYDRFGHRAEALPDPTGTRPPVAEAPPRGEAETKRPRVARSARAA